jgi:hypothetical protein
LSVGSEFLQLLLGRNVEIMRWLLWFDPHEELVIVAVALRSAAFWARAQAVVDNWFLV